MNKHQVLEQVTTLWNTHIAFNQLLGFTITRMDPQESEIRFAWKDELMGNPVQEILHGGVIASVLDMVGGVVAAANIIENLPQLDESIIHEKLSRMSTIDLRTDFLRPGRGNEFIATARIIRKGSKVAVARMELHNEKGTHIAFGTGTYIVG
ncbi:thioesterase family protein [Thalassotalea mangrovi]|uniref:Medium/long-chain acyl-CoA thioesterase YigI n=1 Tax=Thalassotalea mangrovi TaxID=2572245 RepID=A0A4U1B5A6_9GAMM|nr:thioesterase family protein [Thalassotalea mangrovi]TKB45517.1 thioesterase family protein [Thalassotalea mangrovi]